MLKGRTLGTGLTAALLMSGSQFAYAGEYKLGENLTANTSVTLKAGVSFRTDDRNNRNITGPNAARVGSTGGGTALSSTNDDGNANFDRGDIVSAPLTALAEVDFNYKGDYGLFLRGKAVTDLALEFGDVEHGHGPNGYKKGELDDSDFANLAQFSNVALLDAFVYGDFELSDDVLMNVRLGRQVVSWGESALIQGGINSINPIDVSAFRRPGVDLKEGLLPVGMAYVNVGAGDFSAEAFLQFEHQQTVLDGCGTFFSTSDIVAEGCEFLTLGTSASDDLLFAGGGFVDRGPDVEPDDYGVEQGGVALRYYSPGLDTEFGAFWHRTHSNSPNVGFYAGQISPADLGGFNPAATALVANGASQALSDGGLTAGPVVASRYAEQIVEDIDLFGLSAATNIAGLSVAGEVSYRPNQPVQINGNQLTLAAITGGQDPGNPVNPLFFGKNPGEFVEGFSEAKQIKGQINVVGFFDRVLGASRWTVLGEVGFEHLDIDDRAPGLKYGRSTDYGDPRSTGDGGLITDFSWGYRMRASGAYPDVYGGVNVEPSITFSHDVEGTSSDGQFNDNRKGIGLGLGFDYLSTYELDFNYTNFFDGKYNVLDDRDFFSVTAQVKF